MLKNLSAKYIPFFTRITESNKQKLIELSHEWGYNGNQTACLNAILNFVFNNLAQIQELDEHLMRQKTNVEKTRNTVCKKG